MHLINVSVSTSDSFISTIYFFYTPVFKKTVIWFLLRFVVFLNFIVIFGVMVIDYLFFVKMKLNI